MNDIGRNPQIIITGSKITFEQANNIIFCTDKFFDSFLEIYGHAGNKLFIDAFKFTTNLNIIYDMKLSFNELFEFDNFMHNKIKFINTECIANDFIDSSYIQGAHGWCNPDGTIYSTYNSRMKYPSINDIISDFKKIIKKFPFLNMNVTVMEYSDINDNNIPNYNLYINNGRIHKLEPNLSVHGDNIKLYDKDKFKEDLFDLIKMRDKPDGIYPNKRFGLSLDMYIEYVGKIRNYVDEYLELIGKSIKYTKYNKSVNKALNNYLNNEKGNENG